MAEPAVTINIVKIGQENQAGPLARQAAKEAFRLSGEQVRFEEREYRLAALYDETLRPALLEDLAEADILLGGGMFDPDEVDPLINALQQRRPDVVVLAPARSDLAAYAQMGDFDAQKIPMIGVFMTVRQLLQERGAFPGGTPERPTHPQTGGHSHPPASQNGHPYAHAAGQSGPPQAGGHPHNPGQAGPPSMPPATPGMRAYATALLYFTNWSSENAPHFLLHLAQYCRKVQEASIELEPNPPLIYPEGGFWHPAQPDHYFEDYSGFRDWYATYWQQRYPTEPKGRVLVSMFRTQLTSGNAAHYAGAIEALEREGLAAVPRFGENSDPHAPGGILTVTDPVELVLNLTGFNLLGQHGQPNVEAQNKMLLEKDWPLFSPVPLFWQGLTDWGRSKMGLNPGQLALQVAVPEMEGAIFPAVYAGRAGRNERILPNKGQVRRMARLVCRWVELKKKARSQRKIALIIFGYPPNRGALGSASGLDVYASLYNLLAALKAQGYQVDLPVSLDELRGLIQAADDPENRAGGQPGIHLAARFSCYDYQKLFPDHRRITKNWGEAPGQDDVQGEAFLIHGRQFGNVFIGAQPGFGSSGDPLQMLFRPDASPPHAYAAYYTWLQKVWGADAIVHIGTHGSLEFLPGKQAGPTIRNYSDLLVGDTPHFYYYAVNDPSEAAIAKRRSYAVTVSYLTPPVQQAGLYKLLADLHEQVHFYLNTPDPARRDQIWLTIDEMVRQAELEREVPNSKFQIPGSENLEYESPNSELETRNAYLDALHSYLTDLEEELIPVGLHVGGEVPSLEEITDLLWAAMQYERAAAGMSSLPTILASAVGLEWNKLASGAEERDPIIAAGRDFVQAFVSQCREAALTCLENSLYHQADREELNKVLDYAAGLVGRMQEETELAGLLHALDGGFIAPTPGGDPLREPTVLPTGRNIQTLNPFRLPSPSAVQLARLTVERLLERARQDDPAQAWPEAVAMIMWGNETIKTGGEDIAQALHLMGVEAREDAAGRMTDLRLMDLAELGRPRIDVTMTVSGIFRDILPNGMDLLDRAARLAANAEENPADNFIRKHTLALVAAQGISFEEATARVFSNSPGEYGSGVNMLVDGSNWEKSEELGDQFAGRMSFAYGRKHQGKAASRLFDGLLSSVSLTYQNVDSAELSVSDLDHYYEYLGGLSNAVKKRSGTKPKVMLAEGFGPNAAGNGSKVRCLEEKLRVESRTRLLNPKWYEGLLEHGYQGVHEIATRLDNTYGWAATVEASVDDWIFDSAADTYLLDETMRQRLAELNPHASQRMAGRLLEASERGLWQTDRHRLEQLREVYAEFEDAIEGITQPKVKEGQPS